MSGWQPIEIAPRDGTMVLLSGFIFNRPKDGRWVSVGEFIDGEWYERDNSTLHPPTHWMPMPSPPKGV